MLDLNELERSYISRVETFVQKLFAEENLNILDAFNHFDEQVTVRLKTGKYANETVDVVTNIDREVESRLYDALRKEFPEAGFNVEEHKEWNESEKEFVFYLDAIDGTRYFARQLPLFAMQAALTLRGEPVLGQINIPALHENYTGSLVTPAKMNDKHIKVSNCTDPQSALINMMVTMNREHWEQEKSIIFEKMKELLFNVHKVRMTSPSGVVGAWTARGAFDAVIWLTEEHDFDLFPTIALINAAGGKVAKVEIPGLPGIRYSMGNPELVDRCVAIITA